ncbi:hypothetical protein ACFL5Q_02280 [Planctomycetota bacterium]
MVSVMDEKQFSHEQSGKRRFQYGLRSLFVMNLLVALALGVPMYLAQEPGVILAVILLVLGTTWTLLMAAIGDAVGREWGALFQTVLGSAMWSLLVLVVYNMLPVLHLWVINGIAILCTLVGMTVLTRVRLRGPRRPENAPHVTRRLLDSQRERRRKTGAK